MSIDTTPLLMKIAEWADKLEAEFGESAELVDAMLVIEVNHRGDGTRGISEEWPPLDPDDPSTYSYVDYQIMSGRDVVARGLHERMKRILDAE